MANEQVRTLLGANLRRFRSRREWSQTDLAERANISMNYLSEIERGLKWPYPENLQNLANALDIKVYELFKPENETALNMEKYMERFSNDAILAVQEAVKKSLENVKKQHRIKVNR